MSDDGWPAPAGADAASGGPEAAPVRAPAISVVVPVHNGAATITDTLAALRRQRIDAPYEVVVVDGDSSDDTVALIERYIRGAEGSGGPVPRLVRHGDREPGAVRNRGVRAAAGALIAFTDADCVPDPDWLAVGLRAVTNNDIVQGRVLPAGPAGPLDRTVSVGHASGLHETANLFVSRAWFDRVGGFEPLPGFVIGRGPGRGFGEDTWFGWRAQRAGARMAFASDAVVRHAVFPGGVRSHLIEQSRRRWFPGLVAELPELRGTLLHGRLFLTPETMRFDIALAGAAAWIAAGHTTRGRTRRVVRTLAAIAILPYARELGKRSAAPDVVPGVAAPDVGPGATPHTGPGATPHTGPGATPHTRPGAAAHVAGLDAAPPNTRGVAPVLRRIAVASALSAGDAVGAAALAAGSLRHRTAVL